MNLVINFKKANGPKIENKMGIASKMNTSVKVVLVWVEKLYTKANANTLLIKQTNNSEVSEITKLFLNYICCYIN